MNADFCEFMSDMPTLWKNDMIDFEDVDGNSVKAKTSKSNWAIHNRKINLIGQMKNEGQYQQQTNRNNFYRRITPLRKKSSPSFNLPPLLRSTTSFSRSMNNNEQQSRDLDNTLFSLNKRKRNLLRNPSQPDERNRVHESSRYHLFPDDDRKSSRRNRIVHSISKTDDAAIYNGNTLLTSKRILGNLIPSDERSNSRRNSIMDYTSEDGTNSVYNEGDRMENNPIFYPNRDITDTKTRLKLIQAIMEIIKMAKWEEEKKLKSEEEEISQLF